MALRPVFTDRLPFALALAQPMDERRANHERDDHRREHGAASAEGDVVEEVEELGPRCELAQQLQHQSSPWRTARKSERISKPKSLAKCQCKGPLILTCLLV